ncbi:unnamed protein product [Fraxinus pennsylvanica]|uniref:WRKY domain-containing protein n=1 Tax=Fraxinus pennsylvanica TaxID=56036 RepID=A0AAD2DU75_9LAMI|nr:unnamed protein product [Fraxinus pennsylvanica]
MEKVGAWDTKIVISELTQGRDLANELKNQLQPAKSREACGYLVEKILSSYNNALSVLNCMAFLENPSQINGLLGSTSPRSSEGSDLIDSKRVLKKRKKLAKWSEQVRVCWGTGLEGPLDDGYNWRKYGQKNILGAKFPRAYYRCTHQNTQGCLAIKQKEEEDIQRHEAPQNMIILKNETQELDIKEEIFPSFELFSEPMKESNFSASYSPPFFSPTTSKSYFSRMNDFEIHHNFQTSESDFSEIISNPASVTNSPLGDLDFSTDPVDFDPKFLDSIEYF